MKGLEHPFLMRSKNLMKENGKKDSLKKKLRIREKLEEPGKEFRCPMKGDCLIPGLPRNETRTLLSSHVRGVDINRRDHQTSIDITRSVVYLLPLTNTTSHVIDRNWYLSIASKRLPFDLRGGDEQGVVSKRRDLPEVSH